MDITEPHEVRSIPASILYDADIRHTPVYLTWFVYDSVSSSTILQQTRAAVHFSMLSNMLRPFP